jgi:hypothetical protein
MEDEESAFRTASAMGIRSSFEKPGLLYQKIVL